jgi:hypothetical protein
MYGYYPTQKTQALLTAFARAGYPFMSNHATDIAVAIEGSASEGTIGLGFHPALPDGGCLGS